MDGSVKIEGLPELNVVGARIDIVLRELQFEVALTPDQYETLKSDCIIPLGDQKVRLLHLSGEAISLQLKNRVAKMVKLVVYKSQTIGHFTVSFDHFNREKNL